MGRQSRWIRVEFLKIISSNLPYLKNIALDFGSLCKLQWFMTPKIDVNICSLVKRTSLRMWLIVSILQWGKIIISVVTRSTTVRFGTSRVLWKIVCIIGYITIAMRSTHLNTLNTWTLDRDSIFTLLIYTMSSNRADSPRYPASHYRVGEWLAFVAKRQQRNVSICQLYAEKWQLSS